MELPETIRDAESPAEAEARLGALLGLPGPAPAAATARARADPRFARALLGLRRLPDLRDRLLADPGNAAYDPAAPATAPRPAPPAAPALAAKAAGAVLKWGMAGFEHPAPWVIERRLAACAACPHRVPAPPTLVWRGISRATGKDARICALCHCLVNTKAAIASETCPDRDPADPARSRWGEPLAGPAASGAAGAPGGPGA